MASAVSRSSVRRVETLEKDSSISEMKVGVGDVLVGERQRKKKWLLVAMDAWLKREALSVERAYFSTSALGIVVASAVPEEKALAGTATDRFNGGHHEDGHGGDVPIVRRFNFSIIID
jgi:hypothetical protein